MARLTARSPFRQRPKNGPANAGWTSLCESIPIRPWLKRKTKRLIDNFEVVVEFALADGARHPRAEMEPRSAEVAECLALFVAGLRISERAALGAPFHRPSQAETRKSVNVV